MSVRAQPSQPCLQFVLVTQPGQGVDGVKSPKGAQAVLLLVLLLRTGQPRTKFQIKDASDSSLLKRSM